MDFIDYYTWVKAFLQWRNFKIVSSTTVLLSHHLNWFIRSINLNWFIRSINSFSIPSPTPPGCRTSLTIRTDRVPILSFPNIPRYPSSLTALFLPRFSPQVSPCEVVHHPVHRGGRISALGGRTRWRIPLLRLFSLYPLYHKQFHRLFITRYIYSKSATILITQFAIEMLRIFINLRWR